MLVCIVDVSSLRGSSTSQVYGLCDVPSAAILLTEMTSWLYLQSTFGCISPTQCSNPEDVVHTFSDAFLNSKATVSLFRYSKITHFVTLCSGHRLSEDKFNLY
jgi:hypothetical protein